MKPASLYTLVAVAFCSFAWNAFGSSPEARPSHVRVVIEGPQGGGGTDLELKGGNSRNGILTLGGNSPDTVYYTYRIESLNKESTFKVHANYNIHYSSPVAKLEKIEIVLTIGSPAPIKTQIAENIYAYAVLDNP